MVQLTQFVNGKWSFALEKAAAEVPSISQIPPTDDEATVVRTAPSVYVDF